MNKNKNKKLKNGLKIILCAISLFIVSTYFFVNKTDSQEYDPDFAKGRIISDFQMFDYNSMNVSQIQSFLVSKNSYLATYVSPDYQGAMKTASEIIYEAAQRYQVNPKYILVTLQKEQGLIQMQNPTQKRLDWAAGYAVCDSCSMDDPKIQKYKGFGKQMDNTAGAMRFYFDKNSIYDFIKRAGRAYTIDGGQIIFETQATANLYTYTPHVHGNYTFWLIWQRYFGDPLSSSRDANASIYTGYMAQLINSAEKNVAVKEGEIGYFWAEYLNIGTETWNNEDLKSLYIISSNYKPNIPMISQTSSFQATSSILSDIKVYSQKNSVRPGEVLRITIPIESNYNKTESFNYMLVLGNKGWFADSNTDFTTTRQFKYEGEYVGGIDSNLELLKKHTFTIKYKNIGTSSWNKSDTKLKWIDFENKEHYASMTNSKVAPGGVANFVFSDTPKSVGSRKYSLSLYKQINAKQLNKFPSGDYDASVNVSVKLGAQTISNDIPISMKPGEVKTITLRVKNVGSQKWDKNLVLRAYDKISPFTRSIFKDAGWDSTYAIGKINGVVNSGDEYVFTFKIKAPTKIGKYNFYLQLEWGKKYEEIIIDDTFSKKFIIEVSKNVTQAIEKTNNAQATSNIKSAELIGASIPGNMSPLQIKEVAIILKNTGTVNWDNNYVLRSYKSIAPFSASYFYDSSWISSMAISKVNGIVKPGEQYIFTFKIKAPSAKKEYPLYFQLEYGSKYEEILIDKQTYKKFSIIIQ